MLAHRLGLLGGQRHLVFRGVIGVAEVELGSARAVNPLVEKLADIGVGGFLNGFDEIRGHHIFSAIDLQIMFQRAVEGLFAQLMPQHVQHPAALVVNVAVEFRGIVKIETHNRLIVKIRLREPLPRVVPPAVFALILGKMRLAPHRLAEGGETFIEPDIAPILGGDQIAEPLVS